MRNLELEKKIEKISDIYESLNSFDQNIKADGLRIAQNNIIEIIEVVQELVLRLQTQIINN